MSKDLGKHTDFCGGFIEVATPQNECCTKRSFGSDGIGRALERLAKPTYSRIHSSSNVTVLDGRCL